MRESPLTADAVTGAPKVIENALEIGRAHV